MNKIIASALGVAALVLSGCGPTKTATIGMRTDGNGRHVSTYVMKSSGDERTDKTAVRAASANFRWQVRKPRKNHRYVMGVEVKQPVEPLWGSEKKAE